MPQPELQHTGGECRNQPRMPAGGQQRVQLGSTDPAGTSARPTMGWSHLPYSGTELPPLHPGLPQFRRCIPSEDGSDWLRRNKQPTSLALRHTRPR
eukprot:166697-Prymnesium_polylepis.1